VPWRSWVIGEEGTWPDTRLPPSPAEKRKRRFTAIAFLVAGAIGAYWIATGPLGLFYSAPAPSTTSPVATTLSWFDARNHDDGAGVRADSLAAADKDVTDASLRGTSFSKVSCQVSTATTTEADVRCTFHEHTGPGEQTDAFYTVELQRVPPGPWLITNYGTP
jgi:hypothetical protein